MAHFKVEAAKDDASGKWLAELYYPEAMATPFSRSRPIFNSREEALAAAVRAMRRAMEQIELK